MPNIHYNAPKLINFLTGNPLSAEDLKNPRVMVGAFEQMAHEVWRFAPLEQSHAYQKFLPFDYVWHRLSLQFNEDHGVVAHCAITDMLDRVFHHSDKAEVTLSLLT